jgi:ATP-dependent DNA ligase
MQGLMDSRKPHRASVKVRIAESEGSHIGLKPAESGKSHPSPFGRDELLLLPGAQRASMPRSISPMLALLRPQPPAGSEWIFEPKLDGFRTLAYIEQKKVALRSRNETDMTGYFPSVVSELKGVHGPCLLDGETVAVDEHGKT